MKTKTISVAFFLGLSVCAFSQETDEKEKKIEDVILVGTRVAPRTSVNTPLPIDAIDSQILQSSGQPTMDKVLQYRIPSFNSTSAAVQDATSLLDPFEIRNMGSSRTLVLVNGKRKNTSSLMFIQNTIGKGETGADLSAIPNIAIKKVEILRDGASAQYGSDAIAGVMNIILKDKISFSEINSTIGLYSKGDGFSQNVGGITGVTFGEGSFLTFAMGVQNSDYAKRSGTVSAKWDQVFLGGTEEQVADYLKDYPDANNKNYLPKKTAINLLVNSAIKLDESSSVYWNGSYVVKKVNSFANHRTPYWKEQYYAKGTGYGFENPLYNGGVGFTPTFEGDIVDYGGTLGFKTKTATDWNIDASATYGQNDILYTVRNSFNESWGSNSPTTFKPGGYNFQNIIGNIDFSKRISDTFAFAFGSEVRKETFEIYAGDDASYMRGSYAQDLIDKGTPDQANYAYSLGTGAISFPGMDKRNAGKFSRYNIGIYADAAIDFSDNTLLNLTARAENYSDFGSTVVGKASFRQKISGDRLVFRTSVSTGFKAPSLHQLNLSSNQASFSGGTIVIDGTFSNYSKEARQLGVPELKPEKSLNFTVGLGMQPTKNFSLTLDGYYIGVKDRVVLSSRISGLGLPGVNGASFFINGIDTKTKGLDLVASVKNINFVGNSKLGINLAGNINDTKVSGDFKTPAPILERQPNAVMFNRTEEAIVTTSRPKFKAVLGFDVTANKWNFGVNNTLFGPAKWANTDLPNVGEAFNVAGEENMAYLQYHTRVLTDFNIGYKLNNNHSLSFNVINAFNVIPKWTLENIAAEDMDLNMNIATFAGRYPQSAYDSQHFSIFGTQFTLGYNVKF